MMMSGLPDIIACVDGMFVGLETKLDTKVTEIQSLIHEKIVEAGGVAVVVHTKQEALDVVAHIRATRRVGKVRKVK